MKLLKCSQISAKNQILIKFWISKNGRKGEKSREFLFDNHQDKTYHMPRVPLHAGPLLGHSVGSPRVQRSMTALTDSPSLIRSKPRLISSKLNRWVIKPSIGSSLLKSLRLSASTDALDFWLAKNPPNTFCPPIRSPTFTSRLFPDGPKPSPRYQKSSIYIL